jgi:hypothetical protein
MRCIGAPIDSRQQPTQAIRVGMSLGAGPREPPTNLELRPSLMSILLAQSGLFIVSVLGMYIIYGLPLFAVIAAISGMLGGGRGGGRSRLGLGWSTALFMRTFLALAVGTGILVLAACIWAAWTIPGR